MLHSYTLTLTNYLYLSAYQIYTMNLCHVLALYNSLSCYVSCGPQRIMTCKWWRKCEINQPCCVPSKPFIFVLDAAEFIPCPLQLCLQALNANNSLHQVLV